MNMAKTTTIEPYGYFVCPSCVQKDLESDYDCCPIHLAPPHVLGGVNYCLLCMEELRDELTFKLHYRLKQGKVSWGTCHSIEVRKHPGLYEIRVECACRHGISGEIRYYETGFNAYWNLIMSLVQDHYNELKAIL